MELLRPVALGIDGGATHSYGVALDDHGQILARAQSGSLNFFGSGLADARRNLKALLTSLKAALPAGTPFQRVVIGCAALFEEASLPEKELFCRDLIPLERTSLLSDIQTAFYGATLGQPGLLVICGTGSVICARGDSGVVRQIGGWGHILGDTGSAYWIAVESIRAAIAAAEGLGPATALTGLVSRFFQVNTLMEIVPIIHHPLFTKEKLAGLTEYVADRAGPGDPVFDGIRERGGRELAAQALAAIRSAQLSLDPIPVHLVGGVVENDGIFRDALLDSLRLHRPIRVIAVPLSPVLGAAAMSLVDQGVTLTPEIVARLRQSYDNTHANS